MKNLSRVLLLCITMGLIIFNMNLNYLKTNASSDILLNNLLTTAQAFEEGGGSGGFCDNSFDFVIVNQHYGPCGEDYRIKRYDKNDCSGSIEGDCRNGDLQIVYNFNASCEQIAVFETGQQNYSENLPCPE